MEADYLTSGDLAMWESNRHCYKHRDGMAATGIGLAAGLGSGALLLAAAGSVASPYFYEVNITQRLCYPTCADNTPVFNPQFSLKSLSQVGTGRYVATIHVEGIISYVPCNGGCGCTKQQPLSQDFTIPIQSASAPTVTIEQGTAMNAVAASACQPCSRTFVSETPITVTVATAAAPTA